MGCTIDRRSFAFVSRDFDHTVSSMTPSKLKWTAATRKQVHYFRSTHKTDPDGAHALPAPEDAWSALRAIVTAGRVKSSGDLESAVSRATREFSQEEPPAFDRAFELYRYAIVSGLCPTDRAWEDFAAWAPERATLALWSRGTMKHVLEALTEPAPFWRATSSEWTPAASIPIVELRDTPANDCVPPEPSYHPRDSFSIEARGLWAALKMWVDAQSDDEFARNNEVAHAVRRGLDKANPDRGNVALAFARDPSHAREECARAWSSELDESAMAIPLILASPTVADAKGPLDYCASLVFGVLSPFAFDLVEAFGSDAAPALQSAIERLDQRKMNASLKKSLQSPLKAALKLVV